MGYPVEQIGNYFQGTQIFSHESRCIIVCKNVKKIYIFNLHLYKFLHFSQSQLSDNVTLFIWNATIIS